MVPKTYYLHCCLNSILNGFDHDPDALKFNQIFSPTGFVSRGFILDSSNDVEKWPKEPDTKWQHPIQQYPSKEPLISVSPYPRILFCEIPAVKEKGDAEDVHYEGDEHGHQGEDIGHIICGFGVWIASFEAVALFSGVV